MEGASQHTVEDDLAGGDGQLLKVGRNNIGRRVPRLLLLACLQTVILALLLCVLFLYLHHSGTHSSSSSSSFYTFSSYLYGDDDSAGDACESSSLSGLSWVCSKMGILKLTKRRLTV